MSYKLSLGLILFGLGALGILSLLTVSIPLDNLPKQVLDKFTPETIKLLTLINPTILLLIAVIVGTILFDKVKLTLPTITAILKSEKEQISFSEQVKFGVILGLITGFLTTIVGLVFKSSLPYEFVELGNKIKITTIARFAYGGLTEELLMRFGFMTLIVWLVFKMTKQINSFTYWIGIILATILFAFGHIPMAFSVVSNTTILLLTYILVGNSIVGVFFGWLYWKKGLESAFIGHIFAHVVMLVGEQLFQL